MEQEEKKENDGGKVGEEKQVKPLKVKNDEKKEKGGEQKENQMKNKSENVSAGKSMFTLRLVI